MKLMLSVLVLSLQATLVCVFAVLNRQLYFGIPFNVNCKNLLYEESILITFIFSNN